MKAFAKALWVLFKAQVAGVLERQSQRIEKKTISSRPSGYRPRTHNHKPA
jgi:hypothetical protein